MKLYHSKTILLFVACFMCTIEAEARDPEEKAKKGGHLWNALRPKYAKIQYAGGIGLVSAGLGWNYGSSRQWETDVMMGFVPAYDTHSVKTTFTLKQSFLPWNKRPLYSQFTFDPLNCGLAANSMFGREFWVREPNKYPSSYYAFSTKLRIWAHVGQRITYHIPDEKQLRLQSVTLFYEISSCDLYLLSAFTNSYLKPPDYLRLAVGLKFQFH